jgi:hypothetical protein
VPESKETPSAADKNGAENSEKKQQVAADPKPSPAAKTNSKVCGVMKTSVSNSTAEAVRVPVDSDATGKTEVN